jgi:hypothetical protein
MAVLSGSRDFFGSLFAPGFVVSNFHQIGPLLTVEVVRYNVIEVDVIF